MSFSYNHLLECEIQNRKIFFHILGGAVSRRIKTVFILFIKHCSSYYGYIRSYLKT